MRAYQGLAPRAQFGEGGVLKVGVGLWVCIYIYIYTHI